MKFTYGQLVALKTGGTVMTVIDELQLKTQHIENGRYVIEERNPEDLRSLAEFMDIFADREADKKCREYARRRYEKRQEDKAAKKAVLE